MDRVALPAPEAVDALAPEQLPGFIAQLGALAMRAAARMTTVAVVPGPTPSAVGSDGQLTQEEAAACYRIPLRTLRRLTRTQRVASVKVGRNRMLRAVDLEQYLSRCRAQGVAVGTILDV